MLEHLVKLRLPVTAVLFDPRAKKNDKLLIQAVDVGRELSESPFTFRTSNTTAECTAVCDIQHHFPASDKTCC